MGIPSGSLIKGKTYKLKYEDNKRAITVLYEKDHIDAIEPVAVLSGRGGVRFYEYDKIEYAEEVKPKVKKLSEMKECPRCLGNKQFKHLSHVSNGVCFKCGGSGKI